MDTSNQRVTWCCNVTLHQEGPWFDSQMGLKVQIFPVDILPQSKDMEVSMAVQFYVG